MAYKAKKLDKSQIEFSITVTPEEYAPHLEKAAKRISERVAIKGFRKGKAPLETIKAEYGEMAILQEALDNIVKATYFQAVTDEKVDTIGMPQINVEKMAPGNDIEYKATVALVPDVTLPDVKKIKVAYEVKDIDEKAVNETLDAVRGMHAKEVVKDGAATGTDKLVLDMDMSIDKVPVEGGQSKDYQVYLSEQHYVPGFNEQVEGMKKGETKEFTLDFPKNHFQKHLAGKIVEFKVTVKDVFERQLPELDDSMAKALGQDSVAALTDLVKKNMAEEARRKADQKSEIEILDKLIEKAKFSEIPEVLIDAERQKMFYELKGDLERNGVAIDQYLADIKKDEKQLFEEFKEQATKRAKAALVSRKIAEQEKMEVSEEELQAEIKMMETMYKDNPNYMENLKRPEVKNTIATAIQNRKVMQFLKAKILGKQLMEDPNLADMGCKDCKEDHDHSHDEDKKK